MMRDDKSVPLPPVDWQGQLLEELRRVSLLRPWGLALMTLGWIHLGFFLVCQAVYTSGERGKWVSLALWGAEVGSVVVAMRLVAGKGWLHESSVVTLIARIWGTFLILSFNVASLNTLTGFEVDWFKPVWCTLASFGFATSAWLFGSRFLIPAFQMYFTGLIMVRLPEWNYLIHGLSWCLVLQFVGWDLIRRRERLLFASRERSPATVVVTESRERKRKTTAFVPRLS